MDTSRFGFEEGSTCWRDGCQGTIAISPVENCSCHLYAPCGACTSARMYCPECDWNAVDEAQETYVSLAPGICEVVTGPYPPPLDPRKISYRIKSHSNSSQKCEGVCPLGTPIADVVAQVKGTFGGRFEYWTPVGSHITFSYIAYTD